MARPTMISEPVDLAVGRADAPFLSIQALRKTYGRVVAANVERLEVQPGELLSLLGPSGCGKTTTLRCIAGLVQPDAGTITIAGRDVTHLPTHQRNLGMVFQNYALFPHMTVFDNVAYGLENRGLGKVEIRERVEQALHLVALDGYEGRYRNELSGGQQQRVALARAIVYEPDVLLLDEPLSNLDAKLRKTMRIELRRLQQRLGLTAIFVTHDQQEALSLSDTVVVMNQGRVEQVGTPREVYERPRSAFVADFIGSTNLLPATVRGYAAADAEAMVEVEGGAVLRIPHETELSAGDPVRVLVKPEKAHLVVDPAADSAVGGTVVGLSYLGAVTQYLVQVGSHEIEVLEPADHPEAVLEGSAVGLTFERDWLRLIEG